MRFRLISSAIILPALVWAIFHGPVFFRAFILAVCCIGLEEFRRLLAAKGLGFESWLGQALLLLLLLPLALAELMPAVLLNLWRPLFGLPGVALLFCLAASWIVARPDLKHGLPRFLGLVGALAYISVLGASVLLLHRLPLGSWWIFVMFWYAWFYDAFALFVGKSFGKHRMNKLSPSKTWEGFWGGMAATALISALLLPQVLRAWGPAQFPLHGLALGLLAIPASALAQAGDLFESMLKRYAGAKDSSHLISAHGGFLDKMDSNFFVAPFMLAVAAWLAS